MMDFSIPLLAYLGPETMLPMTSILAGVAGVLMMFGRGTVRWLRNSCRAIVSAARRGPAKSRTPRRIGAGPAGEIARRKPSGVRIQG